MREWNGCTCTPSATAPAICTIHGPTAAMSTGGSGCSMGPGDHIWGMRDSSWYLPSKSSFSPRKDSNTAFTAWTYSRMRGPGGSNSTPYRRSMWARTWVPRPSRNFPFVMSCSSQALVAVTVGLRGNATAMPVESCSRGAASAAAATER